MANIRFNTQLEWMIDDLGLSGVRLMAYSIVYGFSQDGVSAFRGGFPYIMKWCGCSKCTARRIMAGLVDEGLISRHDEMVNGIIFPAYQVDISKLDNHSQNERGVSQIDRGVSQIDRGPSQNETHNIKENINRNKGREGFTPPTLEEVKAFFKERDLESDPLAYWMHFSNTGWRLSGGKGSVMKSWQMAALQWERRKDNFGGK